MTKLTSRQRKRSRTAPATILGLAAFGLAGCGEEEVASAVFPDAEACHAAAEEGDSWWTEKDCAEGFAEAQEQHALAAPRYAEEQLCEEEHDGACYVERRDDGTSVFLPIMAGYMIGNMMNTNRASAYHSQPVYRTKLGNFATASGVRMGSLRSTGQVRASNFSAGQNTVKAAPLTRSAVASRGGFGAAPTDGVAARAGS